jgi:WD40 repeat protein
MSTPLAPQIPDLTLLRRIGHGSYGDVWIARTLTGIYRAVKVVARARFEDERPFLRELDGITRFQQAVGDRPRQLALMHVGRDDAAGLFYYVMELADDAATGTDIDPDRYVPLTLKEYMRRGPVAAAEVARLGIELAQVLAELHAEGLIHRDVKPSNIIFVGGMPKLADIGLVSSSDHTLTSLGTPGYSPPEGAGTAKADIYSLGKILYQLVTGMAPQDFPRLPSDLMTREDADAVIELNEIVLRACDPEPAKRYATAQKLLDDLLLLQAGKSVRELHRMRRHLKLLGRMSAVAAIIALIVVGALGWANYRKARQLAVQERTAREQAERDERLARYSADLNVAQLAITSDDYGVARTALRRQIPTAGEPDLRGPEWWAMWNDTSGDASRVLGQPGDAAIRSLRLRPGTDQIFVQRTDGETSLWSLSTGQVVPIASRTHGIGDVTADNRLIVGTVDRDVRLVDLSTGAIGEPQTRGRLLQGVGDGRTVLLGERVEGTVQLQLWDAVDSRSSAEWLVERRPSPLDLAAYAVSPDARLIAASTFWTEGTVRRESLQVWDREDGEVRLTTTLATLARSAAFSADGRWLAVGRVGEPILVFSCERGTVERSLVGPRGEVTAVAFSEDGSRIAAGGQDGALYVWRWPGTETARVLPGHEGPVTVLRWAGSEELYSGSADGTVRQWTVLSEPTVRSIDRLWANVLGDFLFSNDERRLFVTDADGHVQEYNAKSLVALRSIPALFQALALSEDERFLLGLDRNRILVRHDFATAQTEELGMGVSATEHLRVVVASPNQRHALLSPATGQPIIWDLRSLHEVVAETQHGRQAWAAAFAPDGSLVATGDSSGRVEFWRPADGKVVGIEPKTGGPVYSLAVSKGSLWFSGHEDGSIRVWDRSASTNQERITLSGHSGSVTALAVSSDGHRLFSGGDDGFVIVWETKRFRPVAIIPVDSKVQNRATASIYPLRFSPNGTSLLAWTADGRLRVWQVGDSSRED